MPPPDDQHPAPDEPELDSVEQHRDPDVEAPGEEQPGASPSGSGEGLKPAPDDADEGKPPDDVSPAQVV